MTSRYSVRDLERIQDYFSVFEQFTVLGKLAYLSGCKLVELYYGACAKQSENQKNLWVLVSPEGEELLSFATEREDFTPSAVHDALLKHDLATFRSYLFGDSEDDEEETKGEKEALSPVGELMHPPESSTKGNKMSAPSTPQQTSRTAQVDKVLASYTLVSPEL